MLLSRVNGATSVILRVKLLDSSKTDGSGLTGLAYNTSGLIISTIASTEASATVYTAAGSTIETVSTLGTYAQPTATKCRFKEVDATNHKGIYELHFDDARFAISNSRHLVVSISGATNLAQCDFVVDQATTVLLSSGTGTGQLSFTSGRVKADTVYWNGTSVPAENTAGYPIVTVKDGTGTGEIDTASGKVAVATGGITAASFATGAIDAAALAADAGTELAAAIMAAVVESNGSITMKGAMSVMLAALAGVTASGGTVLKDPSGTTTRITATIDGSNNRTAMTIVPQA